MAGMQNAVVCVQVKKIPEPILANITLTILKGMFQLHNKMHMVHRDIKPANILMNSAGEPKITDFGISKSLENTHGMLHTFLGTVTYMSPERIESRPYGYASDIWSLGLCVLECATGRYPYDTTRGPLDLMLQVRDSLFRLRTVVTLSISVHARVMLFLECSTQDHEILCLPEGITSVNNFLRTCSIFTNF